MKVALILILAIFFIACSQEPSGHITLSAVDVQESTQCCTIVINGDLRTCSAPSSRDCSACDAVCEKYSS